MKNTGLIMLWCCALLIVACKTRNSHVQKSSLDSSAIKREQINTDFVAGSSKVQHTSLQIDNDYINGIFLRNFTGKIYPDGQLEGSADEANISQSGKAKLKAENTQAEADSTAISQQVESESAVEMQSKNYDRSKSVKGIAIPWWIWIIVLVVAVLFIRRIWR